MIIHFEVMQIEGESKQRIEKKEVKVKRKSFKLMCQELQNLKMCKTTSKNSSSRINIKKINKFQAKDSNNYYHKIGIIEMIPQSHETNLVTSTIFLYTKTVDYHKKTLKTFHPSTSTLLNTIKQSNRRIIRSIYKI